MVKINLPPIEEQKKIAEEYEKKASVHTWCSQEEKRAFINHARTQGIKLSDWSLQAMLEKMEREQGSE